MTNSFVSNWSEQTFHDLFQQQRMTVLLDDQRTIQADFYFLIDQTFQLKHALTIGFILSENTFMPYLSLTENLFIGSNIREKDKKQALSDCLKYVALSESILNKALTDLSLYEQIKLQLIQWLLIDKDILIIDDIFQELTVHQRQELLPLFQQIAKEKKKAILVLTTDFQIAESPYMDKIIKSA